MREIVNQLLATKSQEEYDHSIQANSSAIGIKELDNILGGGFPKGSVVLLAGSSGCGKTLLTFQWLFEGVRQGENGIYITLTEPLFKSLKNLETMSFYDKSMIEQERLKILDIRSLATDAGLNSDKVIDFIEEQVRETNAKRLCLDSVTAIAYSLDDKAKIRRFIFELGKVLATLGCTTVLTSEVADEKKYSVYGVEEFISDCIVKLDQKKVRGELHRTLQIVKVRGRQYHSEDIYFKITHDGFVLFPRLHLPLEYNVSTERVSTGNTLMDTLLLGGLFRGSTTLVSGATGTGKSLIAMQFIAAGLRKGESCLYAGFEESAEQIIRNAESFGWNFREHVRNGLLTLRCVYPGDRYLEEHSTEIAKIVDEKKIQRCVVDSLSAISDSFGKERFVNFVKNLNAYLKTKSITTVFTSATSGLVGLQTLTQSHLSTLTDNILMLRYVEVEGNLKQVMNLVKVRGSAHSKGLRAYTITEKGIVIGESLAGYEGILTGVTRKVSETIEERLEAEFKRYIGPMASTIFDDVRGEGISRESLFTYIDNLASKKILKKDDAEKFKRSVADILHEGGGEGRVSELDLLKQQLLKK